MGLITKYAAQETADENGRESETQGAGQHKTNWLPGQTFPLTIHTGQDTDFWLGEKKMVMKRVVLGKNEREKQAL